VVEGGSELNIEEKLFAEELINSFNLLHDRRRDQSLDLGYTPYGQVQLEIVELLVLSPKTWELLSTMSDSPNGFLSLLKITLLFCGCETQPLISVGITGCRHKVSYQC
jgi:hypothetical protein